ncbi:MAG: hypothetical protein IJV69_08040 [Kiritimatiellae bacterium]|nr:hypothetical protein [Kiritimatiellia bacterium]
MKTHSCFIALGLLALCGTVLLQCGCASGPSLRSVDTEDAKIVVTEQGQILVHGEPVPLRDLHMVIADSDTESDDLIIVQLPGGSESEEMQRLMRAISREMTFARHYKYSFSTPPKAYTETFDKQTGTTEVFVSGQAVRRLENVAEKEAEVRRMQAEEAAYQQGTYVSDASQKPVSVFKGRSDENRKKQEEQERLKKQWQQRRNASRR